MQSILIHYWSLSVFPSFIGHFEGWDFIAEICRVADSDNCKSGCGIILTGHRCTIAPFSLWNLYLHSIWGSSTTAPSQLNWDSAMFGWGIRSSWGGAWKICLGCPEGEKTMINRHHRGGKFGQTSYWFCTSWLRAPFNSRSWMCFWVSVLRSIDPWPEIQVYMRGCHISQLTEPSPINILSTGREALPGRMSCELRSKMESFKRSKAKYI